MADSDPEVIGGGGEGRGDVRSPEIFFRPFGPQFDLKIRRAGAAPTLDPPLYNEKDGHLSNFS